MELNERKLKILEAIIQDYIESAEPIGSRTIAKKYDLGISSATIRNEMSDLEELGLIIQPYASSGRIPSDKGYRLFVNNILNSRVSNDYNLDTLKALVENNDFKIDDLMNETAKMISLLTNYVTVVSESKNYDSKIKYIQLIPMDGKSFLTVIVMDNKNIENRVISTDCEYSDESLLEATVFLNDKLKGLGTDEIEIDFINNILSTCEKNNAIIKLVLDDILSFSDEDNGFSIHTSGVNNILAFPEFNSVEKAQEVFKIIEEQNTLAEYLAGETSTGFEIIIGEENSVEGMKKCSIIKARYELGDNGYGNICIIGPTRMDYVQTISILENIVKNINNFIGNSDIT